MSSTHSGSKFVRNSNQENEVYGWTNWEAHSDCKLSCLAPAKGLELVQRHCKSGDRCNGVALSVRLCKPTKTTVYISFQIHLNPILRLSIFMFMICSCRLWPMDVQDYKLHLNMQQRFVVNILAKLADFLELECNFHQQKVVLKPFWFYGSSVISNIKLHTFCCYR